MGNNFLRSRQWDVSVSGFVLEELNSVQFHRDIFFYLESDSIVVSFSSSTGFLRVDIRQFLFQHILFSFLLYSLRIVVFIDNLRASTRTRFVT